MLCWLCCATGVLASECVGVGCAEMIDNKWRRSSEESMSDGIRAAKGR